MRESEFFVDLIRNLIRDELDKRDSTALATVDRVGDGTKVDIRLISSPDVLIPNIVNASKYELNVGDIVVVYKINNKMNNAFIIAKASYNS